MQQSILSFFGARVTDLPVPSLFSAHAALPPHATLPSTASASKADAEDDAPSPVKRGYPACTVEDAHALAAPSLAATTSYVPAAAALGSARVEIAIVMVSRIWLKYTADHTDTPTMKKNRTYAVRVKGEHSSVPGLQDLIGMGFQTFGGFWNMPRPWENPHCQVRKFYKHVYFSYRSLTRLFR
jgi:hypothetical protein